MFRMIVWISMVSVMFASVADGGELEIELGGLSKILSAN